MPLATNASPESWATTGVTKCPVSQCSVTLNQDLYNPIVKVNSVLQNAARISSCPSDCIYKRQPKVEETKGTPTRLVAVASRSILPRVARNWTVSA